MVAIAVEASCSHRVSARKRPDMAIPVPIERRCDGKISVATVNWLTSIAPPYLPRRCQHMDDRVCDTTYAVT